MDEEKIAAAVLAASVISKSSDQISTEGAVYLYVECLNWMKKLREEGLSEG